MNAQVTKTDRVRAHVQAGNMDQALRIAHTFRMLEPNDKLLLERAWEAQTRPAFMRQLGRDPDEVLANGHEVLKRLYG